KARLTGTKPARTGPGLEGIAAENGSNPAFRAAASGPQAEAGLVIRRMATQRGCDSVIRRF
ncbi:hypothetical protein, partial [Methylobacterium frigidaeris]|uniref:hypothetical protein n=1 Tax=Methylobacterium frigidaeris TaxID=2038277 RepID=UPI001A9CB71B